MKLAFAVLAIFFFTTPAGVAQKRADAPLVVVSAPAVNYATVMDYLRRGVLPVDGAFARMMRQGTLAPLLPIHSPETGPSRASLWTGALPSEHGIVGNSFRMPGESLSAGTGDFDQPLLVETVLDTARRAGKRVVRLTDWPPSHAVIAGGFDFFPQTLSRSIQLSFAVAGEGQSVLAPPGFVAMQGVPSPLEIPLQNDLGRAVVQLQASATKHIYRARIAVQGRAGAWVEFKYGAWASLPVFGNRAAWVKVIEDADFAATGARGRLYVGPIVEPVNHTVVAKFEREHGHWPGRAEGGMLRAGRMDEATWWEQTERLHQYHLQLSIFMLRRSNPDLLVVDMSWLDSAGHVFLAGHPRQAAYAAEGGARKKRWNAYMEKSYRMLDAALLALQKADPRARFMVVSDHGMMPTHTSIPLQKLFGDLGWQVRSDQKQEVATYASFNSAHVYVAPRRAAEVARLAQFCLALTDPATGERVIAEARTGGEIAQAGFGGPRSGDVWVVAKPGYEIGTEPDGSWTAASMSGTHGYRAEETQNVGLLGMNGAGKSSLPVPITRVTDVASAIRSLLGISTPVQASGPPN